MKKISIIVFLSFLININSYANSSNTQCIIKMGYKTESKEPYIVQDNSGLYKELYSKAAENIGCKLEIIRDSKKRILAQIQKGYIDFYPGFDFSKERAQYAYYIETGLSKKYTTITRSDVEELTFIKQVQKLNLLNLSEQGGTNFYKDSNIKTVEIPDLNLSRAIKMIQRKRADIYTYNKDQIQYYIKVNNPSNIKLHPKLIEIPEAFYIGFSKKSPLLKEIKNSGFNENSPISVENFPTTLDKNSIAFKLEQSLLELKNNGTTQELYNKFFRSKEK